MEKNNKAIADIFEHLFQFTKDHDEIYVQDAWIWNARKGKFLELLNYLKEKYGYVSKREPKFKSGDLVKIWFDDTIYKVLYVHDEPKIGLYNICPIDGSHLVEDMEEEDLVLYE